MRIPSVFRSGVVALLMTGSCWANPSGPNVTSGQAAIQQSGNQMTVIQSSDRAIIQWQSFSIGNGETVQFLQPSALSAVLNRVVGGDPSRILGALRANGQVFLINPNGVLFGPNSQVDVAGLVVSTLNLSDEDFLSGTLNFTQDADKALRAVINRGTIRVQENGMVVLAAPLVSNEGLILAEQGQVALAAGETATVSFDPNRLIHFELGSQDTEPGKVLLHPDSVSEVLQGVVSHPALAPAAKLVQVDGEWQLLGGSGTAIQAGTISADADSGTAGKILVNSNTATVATADSRFTAAGRGEISNGGTILLLSEGQTAALPGAQADISAGQRGDGGFAELSGTTILAGLQVSAEVLEGAEGTYLIDPPILTIADGPMPGVPAPDTVYEESIESSGALVILSADDTVIVEDILDDMITLTSGVDLLIATSNASGDGLIFQDSDDAFVTSGLGSLEVDSASDIGEGGFVSASSVSLLAGGDLGGPDEEVKVTSPLLSLSVGGNAYLETSVGSLAGSVGDDAVVVQAGPISLSALSVGSSLALTASGDILGSLDTGEDATLISLTGSVGTDGMPLSVSIGGELLVAAGDEVSGRSATLSGVVAGGAAVVDTTPGEALLNGSPLPEVSLEAIVEVFDDDDLVDLGEEFGLDDEEIEELEAQLGLLGEDFFHGEDLFGEGEAFEHEDGPGEREGPQRGPGEGRGPSQGTPILAQAGFRSGPQTTSSLLKVGVEHLPLVRVTPHLTSPFDLALEAPDLRADNILDLSALDLSNLDVNLSYDILGDPILSNPSLRAGELFELRVGELSEVPIVVSR